MTFTEQYLLLHMESRIIIWHGVIHGIIFISVWMLLASHGLFVLKSDPFLFGNFVTRAPVLSRLHYLFHVSFTSIVNYHDETNHRDLKNELKALESTSCIQFVALTR